MLFERKNKSLVYKTREKTGIALLCVRNVDFISPMVMDL